MPKSFGPKAKPINNNNNNERKTKMKNEKSRLTKISQIKELAFRTDHIDFEKYNDSDLYRMLQAAKLNSRTSREQTKFAR